MHIDLWLDFTCPYCYLAKTRLDRAIGRLKFKQDIQITYHSYLISPYTERPSLLTPHEWLARHKDIPLLKAKELNEHIKMVAFEEGLDLNYDTLKPANTVEAHKLLKSVKLKNHAQFVSDLYQAHFKDGKDLSCLDDLMPIALKNGLDKLLAQQIYLSNENLDLVKEDIDLGLKIGMKGVPYFVIDHKYSTSGAQSEDYFFDVLEEIYYEQKDAKSHTEFCVGDHCERRK